MREFLQCAQYMYVDIENLSQVFLSLSHEILFQKKKIRKLMRIKIRGKAPNKNIKMSELISL